MFSPSSVSPEGKLSQRVGACFLASVSFSLLTLAAQAAERHVSTTGFDRRGAAVPNDCARLEDPCGTVEWGLAQAQAGDAVLLQRGTYFENVDVKRDLLGVGLLGGYGADPLYVSDPGATVIDGGQSGSTLRFALTDETFDLEVANLTVMGGDADRGGGLYLEASSPASTRLVFSSVNFIGNIARYEGGAIYALSPYPAGHPTGLWLEFRNCLFSQNQSWGSTGGQPVGKGGALFLSSFNLGTFRSTDSRFLSNHASSEGGAIYVYDEGGLSVDLKRNVLDGNIADEQGGGVLFRAATLDGGDVSLENNWVVNNWDGIVVESTSSSFTRLSLSNDTIADNLGTRGGVYAYDTDGGSTSVSLGNVILWGNSPSDLYLHGNSTATASHSDVGVISGAGSYSNAGGNISQNPGFVDAAGGDYHLRWDSPAVDSADCATAPSNDIDAPRTSVRPDLVSGACDMGADEVTLAVLRNGLAPPNASNVIDDDRYLTSSGIDVRDQCFASCVPTFVDVVSGAEMGRWIRSFDSSVVRLLGGATAGGALYASDSSRIEVLGSAFERNGFPERMGDLLAPGGMLSGMLESGESFELDFFQGGAGGNYHGTVRLVPPTDAHLINNGGGPPDRENVIDDSSHKQDFVYVQNRGCSGGVRGCLDFRDTTEVELTGVTGEFQVFGTSRLTMRDGAVNGRLTADDRAWLRLLGGEVQDGLVAFDRATVDLGTAGTGSHVSGDVFAFGSSNLAVTWGSFDGQLWAGGSSTMTVKGGAGSSTRTLYACDSAVVEIHGYEFFLRGVGAIGPGELQATAGELVADLVVGGNASFDFHRGSGSFCGTGSIVLVQGASHIFNAGGLIVLKDDLTYEFHRTSVRNQGCIGDHTTSCASAVATHLRLAQASGVGSRLYVYDGSTVALTGGFVGGEVKGYDDAQISLASGLVREDLWLGDESSFSMSGGQVLGGIAAHGSSRLVIEAGEANSVSASSVSRVEVRGGVIANGLATEGDAVIELRGGEIGGRGLFPKNRSTIRIFGTDFAVDGASVGSGALASQSGTLTGTLESGDLLTASFQQGQPVPSAHTGTIEIIDVPEPLAALLQAFSLLSLALLGRRRAPKARAVARATR